MEHVPNISEMQAVHLCTSGINTFSFSIYLQCITQCDACENSIHAELGCAKRKILSDDHEAAKL